MFNKSKMTLKNIDFKTLKEIIYIHEYNSKKKIGIEYVFINKKELIIFNNNHS